MKGLAIEMETEVSKLTGSEATWHELRHATDSSESLHTAAVEGVSSSPEFGSFLASKSLHVAHTDSGS